MRRRSRRQGSKSPGERNPYCFTHLRENQVRQMDAHLETRVRAAWRAIDARDCQALAAQCAVPAPPEATLAEVASRVAEQYSNAFAAIPEVPADECPSPPMDISSPKRRWPLLVGALVVLALCGLLAWWWMHCSALKRIQEEESDAARLAATRVVAPVTAVAPTALATATSAFLPSALASLPRWGQTEGVMELDSPSTQPTVRPQKRTEMPYLEYANRPRTEPFTFDAVPAEARVRTGIRGALPSLPAQALTPGTGTKIVNQTAPPPRPPTAPTATVSAQASILTQPSAF